MPDPGIGKLDAALAFTTGFYRPGEVDENVGISPGAEA
jgi:hypothetical protein